MKPERQPLSRGLLAPLAFACLAACASAADDSPVPPSDTTSAAGPRAGESTRGVDSRGPTQGQAVPPAANEGTTPTILPYRGVNLSGAEFGSAVPGTDGIDYEFPTKAEVDYFVAKGMNTFRIGFLWERLQRTAYGTFEADYAAKLDAIVTYATGAGATVIVEPHNFARYYGTLIGSSQVPNAVFADFWKRMATRYAADPRIAFNLVNEPHDMPTEQWVGAANAAIAAIRSAGASNLLIVPGNGWSGGHSWYADHYGTSNAIAMNKVVDPADNLLFEVHQYLDPTAGGKTEVCIHTTAGRERLAPFVQWLRENKKRGFVGEFAGGDNSTCRAALTDMFAFMVESADVLRGWLWWGAGPRWHGTYPFLIEPLQTASGMANRPLMSLLTPHLSH